MNFNLKLKKIRTFRKMTQKELSEKIESLNKDNELVKIALTCPGVGPLTASAIVAEVGDASQFRNGREMAAWNGVVPSQHSTGGRSTLGGIINTGNRYLRALLAQCASAVIHNASRHL